MPTPSTRELLVLLKEKSVTVGTGTTTPNKIHIAEFLP
jgi:hypothetical protein